MRICIILVLQIFFNFGCADMHDFDYADMYNFDYADIYNFG